MANVAETLDSCALPDPARTDFGPHRFEPIVALFPQEESHRPPSI